MPTTSPATGNIDISIRGIAKEFGETAALRSVDLDIVRGELIALLGPSGSGKTTLLRIIAGLQIPDRGRIFFGEEDATPIPVQKRGVGFVFQHYALFRHMNVLDNIAYGLRVRERRRRPLESEIRKRVGDLLDLVQLAGLEKRYPAQLSGGQRQRVALARALAVEPKVLLLDEPFGALDAKVRRDLRRWLRDIHDRTGRTTVFVTHDQDEALELADRVAILNQGRIEQIGTPDEVHDAPGSPFVMSFIGATACLPVAVRGGVFFDGKRLSVDAGNLPEGPAELYIRPHDVGLTLAETADVTGRVVHIRRTASGRRAEIAIEGAPEPLELDLPPDSMVAAGDLLGLDLRKGRVFSKR